MTDLVVRVGDRELDGIVRPGESWLGAARRTCASVSGDPVPLDLSAQPLAFALDRTRVEVRAMTRDDLDLAVGWRRDPEVRRWWSSGEIRTEADIARAYGERIDGMSPTRMWLVEVDGHPAGFVQDYRIADYPDFAHQVPEPSAIGVDYALGEQRFRGRGLGPRMLWAWALRARTRFPDATAYFADPDERNAASLRILAKAGFRPGAPIEQVHPDGRTTTMIGCTLDVTTVLGIGEAPTPPDAVT